MKYYEKIIEMELGKPNILYKYAEAARMYGALTLAEENYRKVVQSDTSSSNFPSALFWLANVEKTLAKYDLAIQHFEKFKTLPNADKSQVETTETELEECEWAMEQINNPDAGVIIERLPNEPNTEESEFGAVQRGDTMFYSSFRQIDWKDENYPPRPIVKVMEFIDGREPTQAVFNDPRRHTAHTALNAAGDIMIFNKCDYVDVATIRCELFFSKKANDGSWLPGMKLPAPINIEGKTATQPNIVSNADGSYTLYFVSDADGGKGGLDVWKASFSSEGEFSNPENLTELNTKEDDVTPFFDAKNQILYFSSLGYRSLGGFDIFKCSLNEGKFSEPENIGMPFNSSYHDVYFALQSDEWVYFSSNRVGSTVLSDDACCYDIYKGIYLSLKLETLAFSKLSNEPLDEVIFTLVEKPQIAPVLSRFSGDKNNAEFDIKREKRYQIIASKEGYKADTVDLLTNTLPKSRKFVEKLYLQPTDFALNVRTFNQFYKSPLKGVHIRLLEMPGNVKDEQNTKDSNEADLSVKAETQYTIIASKEGFFPDTVVVGATELKPGARVTKNLFLTPSSLNNFLPIALYFDNDHPDPRTRKETTDQPYDQTYDRYIVRKDLFISEFTKGMNAEEKASAETRLNAFFEEEVKGGFMKLDYFAKNMSMFLDNKYKVEIMVKGFASPLANTDYNTALTKRRIASVMNYFRRVENGKFLPYLLNGQLSVEILPLGESKSATGVSDNPRDKRQSVFSVEASRERRAEILEIRLTRGFKG